VAIGTGAYMLRATHGRLVLAEAAGTGGSPSRPT
jgi:hypothetical protein